MLDLGIKAKVVGVTSEDRRNALREFSREFGGDVAQLIDTLTDEDLAKPIEIYLSRAAHSHQMVAQAKYYKTLKREHLVKLAAEIMLAAWRTNGKD